MKTFEAYSMCHNITCISIMFELHMCRTKTDDKDIKKALSYFAGLYQVNVKSHGPLLYAGV